MQQANHRKNEPVLLFLIANGSLPDKLVRSSASSPKTDEKEGKYRVKENFNGCLPGQSMWVSCIPFSYTKREKKIQNWD